MARQSSGRLHWNTIHTATPCWLLFIDGRPGDLPTMLPVYDARTPRDASHAAFTRLIAEMLQRGTGQQPQQVQCTRIEEGIVYYCVAMYAGPA